MATHLLGASVALHDLIRLRSECAPWRRRALHTGAAGGMRRTVRHGRGIEFEEVRAYQSTDDARSIDWRVTARKGKPHTKVYREEHEQPLLLGVDLRRPMQFGSRDRFKSVAAAELCALLAWAALEDDDRVGGAVATTHGLKLFPPRRADAAVLQLLACVAKGTQLPAAEAVPTTTLVPPPPPLALETLLSAIARDARTGHRCVIISDFHDLTASGVQRIQQIARRRVTTCALVFDPLEVELPLPDRYRLRTAHGAGTAVLDAREDALRARHRERFVQRRGMLQALARAAGVRTLELCVDSHTAALAFQRGRNLLQGPR